MLKILILAGQLGGGGAEKQLALFLRHAGPEIEPSCLVLNGGGIWQDPVRSACVRFRVSRWSAPPARALEFLGVAKRWRPDLVHCWHAYPFVYPLVSRLLHRRPVVVNVRGDLTVEGSTGRPGLARFYRMLRRVDQVVANSAHSLEALEREGLRLGRTEIIDNGIEVFDRAPCRGSGAGVRLVGVGSLRPIKNWSQLIRVCGELIAAGHAADLTIYGEGEQRQELESLCSRWGLDPQRTLPGYVPDLRERLARADILVHSSLSEGLPNAILEALAEGLTVVASDLQVCRELQRRSGCLDLFQVGDDRELRMSLERWIEEPARLEPRRERARQFVRDNFDCGEMAARYVALYRRLADPTQGAGRAAGGIA
jgi:glycosyltransferase involved in cell wall biosynthesis